MKPPVPQVLELIADRLIELTATNDDPVLASDLTRISVMVRTVGVEYDRCVEARVEEAEGLVRWLSRVRELGLADGEGADLDEVLRTAERAAGELRVSAVEARLDALRRAAASVQGALEARDDPQSRRLLDESWRFLGVALRRDAWLGSMW
jgi:hypothetical protein